MSANAGPNPYVGPKPFELGQKLFGRDREVAEIGYLLTSERIVLLYAPSGAGKSSLVQAGLLPRLEKRFDAWGITRVGQTPPKGVENRYAWSAISGLEKSTDIPPKMTLAEYAAKRPRKKNPLILFDQFEEVLRVDPVDVKVKRAFFEQLGEMLRDPSIWALFILREDYLAPLDTYRQLVPTYLQNRYRLDRLTCEMAAEAIAKPLETTPRTYAPGVVDTLVQNLARMKVQQLDGTFREEVGAYVEPLQLQVVCLDIWDRMDKNKSDDLVIDKVGNIGNALSNYYAHAVETVAKGEETCERQIRQWFQTKLITADGIRNQVRQGTGQSGGLDEGYVKGLVDAYIVRAEPRGGTTWYELSHDRLILPVLEDNRRWFDEHLSTLQKAASLWAERGKPEGLLLLGEALVAARREAEKLRASQHGLEASETEFLAASEAAQEEIDRKQEQLRREREQAKRLQRWLIVASAACALSVIALGVAVWQTHKANVQTIGAEKARGQAKEEQIAADHAKKDALALKDAAYGARKTADEQKGIAIKAKTAAENSAREAQRNLARLFDDKAANALARVDSEGSATDYQNAWIYTTALLAKQADWKPETAGRLLRQDLYPGYRPPQSEPALLSGLTEAVFLPDLQGLVYTTETDRKTQNDCSITTSLLHCQGSCGVLPVNKSMGKVDGFSMGADGKHLFFIDSNRMRFSFDIADRQTGNQMPAEQEKCPNPNENRDTAHFAEASSSGAPAVEAVASEEDHIELQTPSGSTDRGFRPTPPPGLVQSIPTDGGITSLAFWPGSTLLVSGHKDGSVAVWDTRTGAKLACIRLRRDAVVAIAFSKNGDRMATASRDGVVGYTKLQIPALGKTWDVKTLLMQTKEGQDLRSHMYADSRAQLGFDPNKDEPTPLADARMQALKYFAREQDIHFTQGEKGSSLLLRNRNPDHYPYPIVHGNEIQLMPDQVGGYADAALSKRDLRTGFKVEFEYQIKSKNHANPWMVGDGFSFLFYKDTGPYKAGNLGKFGFNPDSGYGVAFNAYESEGNGIWLYDHSQDPQINTGIETYTGDNWAKACIEVSPETSTPTCAAPGSHSDLSDAGTFQGIAVYLDGKKVFVHPGKLDTTFGGFGFGSSTGEAMAEQTVRGVRITPAGASQPDPQLLDFVSYGHFSKLRDYPLFTDEGLLLTEDTLREAAAVLLNESVRIPADFSVEFEYSMVNKCFLNASCNDYSKKIPGDGLAFMFGKDRASYKTEVLPMDGEHGVIPGAGYGIVFNTSNGQRSIELRGSGGELIQSGSALSLPDIYPGEDKSHKKIWRTVRVEVNSTLGFVRVLYEGVEVLNHPVDLKNAPNGIGFAAATKAFFGGTGQAEHWIRGVVIRDLNPRRNELVSPPKANMYNLIPQ